MWMIIVLYDKLADMICLLAILLILRCLRATCNRSEHCTFFEYHVEIRIAECRSKNFKSKHAYDVHRNHQANVGTLCANSGMMFPRSVEFSANVATSRLIRNPCTLSFLLCRGLQNIAENYIRYHATTN
jgi:hypothetical protein